MNRRRDKRNHRKETVENEGIGYAIVQAWDRGLNDGRLNRPMRRYPEGARRNAYLKARSLIRGAA